MKKKFLLLTVLVMTFICLFAISVSAESKIIKLETLPTLAQIHANPDAYISRLDTFETGETYASWREKDPDSVVVLSDLAETPTYYVYPSYYIYQTTYQSPQVTNLNSAITTADANAFANFVATGGRGGNAAIIRLEVPTYVTYMDGWNKFEGATNVKEIYFPTKVVVDAETGEEKTVACVTTVLNQNTFNGCSNLEVMHNVQYLPKGIVNSGSFGGCAKLKTFIFPEGVTSIPSGLFEGCYKLENVVIPEGVTSIGKAAFENCDTMTEVILPNSVTTVAKRSFNNMNSLVTINFGAGLTTLSESDSNCEIINSCPNVKFIYIPVTFAQTISGNTKGNGILSSGSEVTIFFTGTKEEAKTVQSRLTANSMSNPLISKLDPETDFLAYDKTIDYTTYAQETLNKTILVYNYNYCKAFYDEVHATGEVKTCKEAVACTREQCDFVQTEPYADHALSKTFVYANGFDKEGKYTCVCTNAKYCTVENKDEVTEPIIVFKGYSTPESDKYTGINAGFKVDTTLLGQYEKVNGEDVKFNLLMISSKIGDQNISEILNGEELAENVKGVNIKISSSNYSLIKVELRGFDKTNETGNFYTLTLITAIAVHTKEGTHYVQGGLKNSPNTTITVDGVDFNIVTANQIYNPTN